MENDRTEEILRRLDLLEHKFESLAQRVRQLENPAPQRYFPRTPPPVQPPPRREAAFAEPQPQPQRPWSPPQAQEAASPAAAYTPPPKKDIEYLIGAKVLPKAGAVFMIIALTFLVILGYSRGIITPTMMFAIEVAFCAAFVLVGIVKRDMKEEFGQILTAIGSCGLYLVFAGGDLYYKLYSDETLVILFVALSLANLLFSYWRSSKAFLGIGLIGGLVTASVITNLKSDHSMVNAWIHFVILVPSALIIAKNKWTPMSLWLWLASTLSLIPILSNSLPWFDKVAILYGATAICLAAYGWSYMKDVDNWNVIPPVILWITGLIGLGIAHDPQGAWQFAGFFLVFGAMAAYFKEQVKARNSLLIGAVGVPLTLAPFCFTTVQATIIFATVSIAAGLVGMKYIPKPASITGLVEVMLAGILYMQLAPTRLDWQLETQILLLIVAAIIVTSRALVKAYGQNETYSLTAIALCVPLLARMSTVLLGRPEVGLRPEFSVAVALLAFCYYLLVLYFRTRWQSALIIFWCVYVLATASYALAAFWLNVPLDLSLVIPLMIAPVLSAAITPEKFKDAANAWTTVIVGVFFTRLVVVLAVPYLGWTQATACLVGAVVYALTCFVAVWTMQRKHFVYAGWILLALAAGAYLLEWNAALELNIWLTSLVLGCFVLGGRVTPRVSPGMKGELAILLALGGWLIFSRWAWVVLQLSIPSLNSSPAISIAWTSYFFGLIMLGFMYRVVQFRYVAFVVLAMTIGKILVVDLATTDALIRVAVTIVASLVMLAAGYWYVRTREQSAAIGNSVNSKQ